MNTIAIALFALVATASALPVAPAVGQEKDATILSQYNEQTPDGNFRNGYQSENGISVQEEGTATNVGKEIQAAVVRGQARWISPEGVNVELNWLAGPDGVTFTGTHVPVPQPLSEELQRSLAFSAAHPYVEPVQPAQPKTQ